MTLKDKLLVKIYGKRYLEFYYIDGMLEAYHDGLPRTDLPVATGELGWIEGRVLQYLTSHNFLESFGNGYKITAQGVMHLDKGGCRGEFIQHKLSRFSALLSVISMVLSICAVIVALAK